MKTFLPGFVIGHFHIKGVLLDIAVQPIDFAAEGNGQPIAGNLHRRVWLAVAKGHFKGNGLKERNLKLLPHILHHRLGQLPSPAEQAAQAGGFL